MDYLKIAMRVAGFWHGYFNGVTIFISWIISLIDDDIVIYAAHNSGDWYNNFGFVLGVSSLSALRSKGSK